jgi:hypothetical protein
VIQGVFLCQVERIEAAAKLVIYSWTLVSSSVCVLFTGAANSSQENLCFHNYTTSVGMYAHHSVDDVGYYHSEVG